MIEAPVLHVNGDDPEAVVLCTQLALDYRQQFNKDVVVDIICFRKLGHNEQDTPSLTQPLMYKKIAQHPGTRRLYGDKLVAQGVLPADGPDRMVKELRAALDEGKHTADPVLTNFKSKYAVDWAPFLGTQVDRRRRHRAAAGRDQAPGRAHHHGARQLQGAPAGGEGAGRPRRDGPRRDQRRLGHGRTPGLCLAGGQRLRGAPVGRGLRPRHLHPPPRGAARPEPREVGHRHLRAAGERGRQPGAVRGHRLAAVRRSGAGLRIRLRLGRAEHAGHLGGAVRRLRQRRAGGDRPVHRLGRGEVGPRQRPDADAAARLRRAGAGASARRGSSASCSWRPTTTCRSCSRPRPARSSTCCAGRWCASSASR